MVYLYRPLSPNDVPLTFVTSNKYLGVIIHDKHQDDDDIMRCVKSLYSRGNKLIMFLSKINLMILMKAISRS